MKTRWTKHRYLLAFGVAILLGVGGCNGDQGSDTKKCSTGHHMAEGGACEKNTNERCGKPNSTVVVDCTKHGNATAGICNAAGECEATACKDGYRLSHGQCVEDNLSSCDTSDDCADLSGWVGGICEDGQCMATSCATGYCLQNDVCINGKSNVIACGVKGGEQTCRNCSAEDDARCVEGECQATNCAPTECYYQNSVCLNADNHCGFECVNCNEANYASQGKCDNDSGICTIIACKEAHHFNEIKTKCESDTVEACGSPDNDCTKQEGWLSGSCIQGECIVSECVSGYHLAEGVVGECVEDTITSCGSYDNSCYEVTGWGDGTCFDGQCQLDWCSVGFCLNGNECLEGRTNALACGIDGNSCKSCSDTEECIVGKCIVPACHEDDDCTQFRGVRDVACQFGVCRDLFCEANYTEVSYKCKADCGGKAAACAPNEICVGGQCRCGTGSSTCSPSQRCCQVKGTPTNICVDEEEVGSDTFACP